MRTLAIVVLGIATIFVGGCMVDKTTKLSSSGTDSNDKAPALPSVLPSGAKGSASTGEVSGIAMSKDELSAKSDVPLYPGATVPEGQSSVVQTGAETRYELNMVTSDSPDKVADFFKSKMHVDKSVNGNKIDMLGDTAKGMLVQITITKSDGKTYVKAVSLEESK